MISSVDRPLELSCRDGSSRGCEDLPVFRFCKTDNHADVLIPYFHFYVTVSCSPRSFQAGPLVTIETRIGNLHD